jgi:hypothetical protein
MAQYNSLYEAHIKLRLKQGFRVELKAHFLLQTFRPTNLMLFKAYSISLKLNNEIEFMSQVNTLGLVHRQSQKITEKMLK